ncbi:MAG: hypothetical protein FJ100_06485 [Deltaproteobacteria bacterium]|nr:hypothetical protein [Deltaproteobacteria bacterium]
MSSTSNASRDGGDRAPSRAVLACLASMFAVLAIAGGCNQGTTIGANQAVGESKKEAERTVSGNDLRQKGGLCDVNRRVSNPDPASPEGVIWRMYQIAQKPDTEESLKEFVALFPASKNPREIKENYWARVRANVHKYVLEPGKPDYTICRTAHRDDGRMYYVVTKDARQSPPPITVGPVDGANKIVFLTPF